MLDKKRRITARSIILFLTLVDIFAIHSIYNMDIFGLKRILQSREDAVIKPVRCVISRYVV